MAAKKTIKKTTTKKPSNSKTTKSSTLKKSTKTVNKPTKSKTKAKVVNLKPQKEKDIEIEYYVCLKKYYVKVDPNTNEKNYKKMWIVIGDDHKGYRKFRTQFEAINYFRNLKKYAKMRVQSVSSTGTDFYKTIHTFLLLEFQGVDVDKVLKENKTKSNIKQTTNDSADYEDEFSKFDVIEKDYAKYDYKKADKIISEHEKDIVVLDSTQELNAELLKKINSEINYDIEEIQNNNVDNVDIELEEIDNQTLNTNQNELSDDDKFEKSLILDLSKKQEIPKNETPEFDNLYDLSQSSMDSNDDIDQPATPIVPTFSKEQLQNNNQNENTNDIENEKYEDLELDDELEITNLSKKSNSKGKTILYWLVIITISLIAIAIIVLGILAAFKK